ncbi:MAG TPA: ABC transporter substrate-binding protein [Candidatus Binatia bacterium]|nr:ABC transporter substrate-binding protein [Candidatus Binatia bacterium]
MNSPVTRLLATAVLLLVGSVAVPAQPPGKIPRVGVLRPGSPPPEDFGQREAFEAGLRELGWRPGTNILIEYRYAGGQDERLAELAAELVRLPVDVIVASAPQGVRAAQRATRSIPIVMSTLPDPLGQGLVASLARPGGNTTGLTLDSEELAGKQLELLKDALPALTRVGVLRNPQSPGYDVAKRQIAAAARRLQLDVRDFPVSRPEDLPRAFAAMSRAGVGAVLVRRDVLVLEPHRARILALAAERRLPAMYNFRQFPESGGFMSYGADLNDIHRRSASFVDRILKGAKPADLPIEQPTKFELVINLRTARALGVTIPPSLRLRADVLIE